jgi:striatin 1/3/4
MLPWTPPASLSMQGNQQHHQQQQGELHSIGMQHQQQLANLHQQQQQQQQMQMQGGQQQQQQQQPHDPSAPGLQNQPSPLTLSQVLHFLQTEWRRYERERNEWEIERGEMRVRVYILTLL